MSNFLKLFAKLYLGLVSAYDACGWTVKIFTKTAVLDKEGYSEFFSDHDFKNKEWGGTIIGLNQLILPLCIKFR